MNFREIQMIGSALNQNAGRIWPVLLWRAVCKKKSIFSKTRWAGKNDPEAAFVNRISMAPSLYLALADRHGKEHALKVMEKILVPIGCEEQQQHLNSLGNAITSDMARLMAFNDLMDQKGAPRFNQRYYVKRDDTVCHFRITRCVFYDFFTEAGTPELTRLFCEVDRKFFPSAFPGLRFHRNGSWQNTIAYGKVPCEFVFEADQGL